MISVLCFIRKHSLGANEYLIAKDPVQQVHFWLGSAGTLLTMTVFVSFSSVLFPFANIPASEYWLSVFFLIWMMIPIQSLFAFIPQHACERFAGWQRHTFKEMASPCLDVESVHLAYDQALLATFTFSKRLLVVASHLGGILISYIASMIIFVESWSSSTDFAKVYVLPSIVWPSVSSCLVALYIRKVRKNSERLTGENAARACKLQPTESQTISDIVAAMQSR